jgi:hypothetical protein
MIPLFLSLAYISCQNESFISGPYKVKHFLIADGCPLIGGGCLFAFFGGKLEIWQYAKYFLGGHSNGKEIIT